MAVREQTAQGTARSQRACFPSEVSASHPSLEQRCWRWYEEREQVGSPIDEGRRDRKHGLQQVFVVQCWMSPHVSLHRGISGLQVGTNRTAPRIFNEV